MLVTSEAKGPNPYTVHDPDGVVDAEEAKGATALMRDFKMLPDIKEEDEGEEGEGGEEEEKEEPEITDIAGPLDKIARFAKNVHISSEARREYLKLMAMAYHQDPKFGQLRERVPPKLNHTRWNSRLKQLHFVLQVTAGYNFVCRNTKRKAYEGLSLSPYEIKLLENIRDVGEVAQEVTLEFEKDGGYAYKMLDRFGDVLHILGIEIANAKTKLSDPASAATDPFVLGLEKMQTKMKRYQRLASETKSIVIAAALHPKYRLTRMERDYPALTAKARAYIEAEIAELSSASPPAVSAQFSVTSPIPRKEKWKRDPIEGLSAHIIPKNSDVEAFFGGRYPWQDAPAGSKVLEDPVLAWWRDNENNLPMLSQVARRYLCAPAATSAVERVFSRAGRYVSNRRPLGPKTLRHLVISNALILAGYDPNLTDAEVTAAAEKAKGKRRAVP